MKNKIQNKCSFQIFFAFARALEKIHSRYKTAVKRFTITRRHFYAVLMKIRTRKLATLVTRERNFTAIAINAAKKNRDERLRLIVFPPTPQFINATNWR
jgi:hypothetical protein